MNIHYSIIEIVSRDTSRMEQVRTKLERRGFKIRTRPDPGEPVQDLRDPDILLIDGALIAADMFLPGNIPILVLTGEDASDFPPHAEGLPIRGYVPVAASPGFMAAAVKTALKMHTEYAVLSETVEGCRRIIDKAGAGYFRISLDGTFESVNESWLRIHGYTSPEEVLGRHFSLTQVDEDLPEASTNIRKLLNGESIAAGTFSRRNKDGSIGYHKFSASPVVRFGAVAGIEGFLVDMTDQILAKDALNKRIIALSLPLVDLDAIEFSDLFNIDQLQQLQDELAGATGVASIITRPDGTNITKPSNYRRLCRDIIRNNENGFANCLSSDAELARPLLGGPIIRHCGGVGLLEAGASIYVGGRHVANWCVGQVRDEDLDIDAMLSYADVIGVDREEYRAALLEVPAMSGKRFGEIAKALYTLTNELSLRAYQNVQQARFITKQKRLESDLRKSATEWRTTFDGVSDGVCLLDKDMTILCCNDAVAGLLNISPVEMKGRHCFEFVHGMDKPIEECPVGRMRVSLKRESVELQLRDRWFEVTVDPVLDDSGELTGIVHIVRDATERKRMEAKLKNLITEKEAMLRELEHRVKNNLSLVASLLNLESSKLRDEASRKVFEELENRIRSIAYIYDHLYQSGDLAKVDLSLYIQDLANALFQAYASDKNLISLKVNVCKVSLDLKRAVTLGLIINEAITNALKYAFPAGKKGEIRVQSVETGGRFSVKVSDNGAGLPGSVTEKEGGGFGLNLVRMLGEELGAQFSLGSGKGTSLVVDFKL